MSRPLCYSLLWIVLAGTLPTPARAETSVISPATALRHGLTRAWRTQVELDRSIDKIAYITQEGGILYAQTSHATVHALDAETGKKIWNVQIGRRDQTSLAPGVNEKLLAVINGSTLYVVERSTGRLVFERQLSGAPGAGAAVSGNWVFVGMVDGLLQGFNIEDPKAIPWSYKSTGRILIQPVITYASIAWTTDRGHFYVADCDTAKVRFRVETQGAITSRPAHWTPYLYAGSRDGNVYAVNEVTGKTAWKFPTGRPIGKQPAVVENQVFALPDNGDMVCIDGKSGRELWSAPGIVEFCSASPSRVYVIDTLNRLTTLDRKYGSRLDTMPLGDVRFKLINQQTDRIYLAGQDGVIQCLHEAGLDKPVVYTPPPLEGMGYRANAKSKPPAPKAPEEPEEKKADEPLSDDAEPMDDAAGNPFEAE